MKNLLIISLCLLLSLQVFGQKSTDTIISKNLQNLKLKVLYFHITNRCNTCFSIEANVRKTLFDYFINEIDSGLVDLYIMNCELPENAKIVEKYNAYGATLALTSYKNGKELKTEDLSNWAFQKIHNPEIFISEFKIKIQELLK